MEREVMTWNVPTADGMHTVEYYPATGFKAAKLLVDGNETLLVKKPTEAGFDIPILTGGGTISAFRLREGISKTPTLRMTAYT